MNRVPALGADDRSSLIYRHTVFRHFPAPYDAFKILVAEWTSNSIEGGYTVQAKDSNRLMSMTIVAVKEPRA